MPDLGDRANVMGPQPIADRFAPDPAMIATANHVLQLLIVSKADELAALSAPSGAKSIAELVAGVPAGRYDRSEIVATARVNAHHYVKARLLGPRAEPITLQFRLGQSDGRWLIWEAVNLSGGRTAWTR